MRYKILGLLALACDCYATSQTYSGGHPWFTGPLLTPSPRVTPVGHFLIEPYVYLTFINGRYLNNWSFERTPSTTKVNPLSIVRIGLTEKMNFATTIQGFVNTTENRTSVSFADLPIALEYELYNDKENFAKIFIQELFPTGKYQNLDPEKFGTDAGGEGSYVTSISVGLGKLIHFYESHYLSLRLFLSSGFGTPVKVKGFNAFGGDPTTKGKVYVGPTLAAFFGAEYTLTENWALALDIAAQYSDSDRFRGTTVVPSNFPPAVNISMAPALEYNFNENIGIISGCWFSLAGRNSNQFTSFATAVNIYY